MGTSLVLCILVAAALLGLSPSVDHAEERVAALVGAHQVRDLGTVSESADAVPPKFTAALVATEDARFFSHHGIDSLGMVRAGWVALTGSGEDPGGATLDQQLAKQLYFGGEQGGSWTTVEQVALGVKLDALYPKTQILEMYGAVVYFGHGYYGLDAASHGYFGLRPSQLSWGQAALLAGLVQAPSAYDPLAHLDLAQSRQRHVLDRLVDSGDLTPVQADQAAAAPLHLIAHPR